MKKQNPSIVLNSFCFRQFDQEYKGGTKIPMKKEEFLSQLISIIEREKCELKEGYAPFCKHYFVPNFADCDAGYLKIEDVNRKYIETEYQSRRKEELPVLVRFIRKDYLKELKFPKANFLDIILYSKEQIDLEEQSMGGSTTTDEEYDFGVVSIKSIFQDSEVPMNPITMWRNALGKEFGGSGKTFTKEEYLESVNFWKDHVNIV